MLTTLAALWIMYQTPTGPAFTDDPENVPEAYRDAAEPLEPSPLVCYARFTPSDDGTRELVRVCPESPTR